MCDPVSLTMAASTAIGAAGSVYSSVSAANAQKKQAANVAAWQQEQQRMRNAEKVRQEQFRQEADAERMKTVQALDAPEQQAAQETEQERLAALMEGQGDEIPAEAGGPISVADKELADVTGSPTNSEDFRSDMAKKINEATKGARERIKNMATVGSYGNSFSGLQNRNQQLLEQSGRGIDKFNEFRRGSMSNFGLEKAIDPAQVTGSTSPLPELFSAAFQMGTQGLGNAYGAKGAFPAAPLASTQKVVGGADPWANLRKTGKITSARPGLF